MYYLPGEFSVVRNPRKWRLAANTKATLVPGRVVDRTFANPLQVVGCRVTAKPKERGRIFVCGIGYRLRMKTVSRKFES